MKAKMKILVAISFVILAISLIFFLMIYQPGIGMYVKAEKITDSPEKYVEFNLTDLEKYPYVKEAVMNPGKEIEVPFDNNDNMNEFSEIMYTNETEYLKLNGEYYHINYYSLD